MLYGEYVQHHTVPGFWCEHTEDDFPTTRIRSHATPEITIVCYGATLLDAEKAMDRLFEDHEVVAEIICPTQIYPLRMDPIVESARASRRVLVVEEGQLFCGFGAEVVAAVHEACAGTPLLTRRLGADPHPLPCCKSAEVESLPGVDSIVEVSLEMLGHG
jgi:2-oxoisovalerate dehydrogenase E1 component